MTTNLNPQHQIGLRQVVSLTNKWANEQINLSANYFISNREM